MCLRQQNGPYTPGMVDRAVQGAEMADAQHRARQSPTRVIRGRKSYD